MQKITSSVRMEMGIPRLFINGINSAPMAYMTYFTERNHYRDFSEAGYRLYSVPVFFGGRGINTYSHISPFSKGVFDREEKADYEIFDREIERILQAEPDAYIFPRVNVMMPEWWCEKNPLECNDIGIAGDPPRECFSSDKWREDAGIMLENLIAHVEVSKYREHIVGYQIAGGKTEEWLSFDDAGNVGPAAREKFRERYPEAEIGESYQWKRFLSRIVAESIDYLASVAKECTGRRLVIGCFYGYTLEVTDIYSGHHAMELLLNSENIDFFCAPSSYATGRKPGTDWGCMTALDSIILHGKMFFTEYDTRTHLTRPLREARPDGCLPGTYEGGVWQGPESPEVTIGLLKNNIARQLTHGTGSWWFDMWGGWFAQSTLMEELGAYRNCAVQSLSDEGCEASQVAVFVDEDAFALLPRSCEAVRKCCSQSREVLGFAGAPYAIYQVGDFEAVKKRYRAIILLMPAETKRLRVASQWCKDEGIPYMVLEDDNMPITAGELRTFYHSAGVHIWCESDDVIYAGNGWLSIHAATAGKKTLVLPEDMFVTEVLCGGGTDVVETGMADEAGDAVRPVRNLCLNMEQFETRLFRIRKEYR